MMLSSTSLVACSPHAIQLMKPSGSCPGNGHRVASRTGSSAAARKRVRADGSGIGAKGSTPANPERVAGHARATYRPGLGCYITKSNGDQDQQNRACAARQVGTTGNPDAPSSSRSKCLWCGCGPNVESAIKP